MSFSKKELRRLSAALLCMGSAFALSAAELAPDNPASAEFQTRQKANRDRIEELMKAQDLKGDMVFFAVQPMSEIMRLGDVFPRDGRFNGELRAVAAQDEYEPVSFQLFSLNDKKQVTFSISDLKSKKGATIPSGYLDLKVVKIWYQNGNRWISYFSDVGLRLCPELLLKDENMIQVDTKEVANYARIRKDGKDSFVWISAPRGMDAGFNQYQEGFEDAEQMCPVSLDKNTFKQFFVTIHVPKDQTPGVYSGSITVKADGKEITAIPLKLRVLPFSLPLPATYQKLDQPVFCSAMGGGFGISHARAIYKDEAEAMKMYRKKLENAKAHSMFHPGVNQTEENIRILREMGFPIRPWYGKNNVPWFAHNFGGRMKFDEMMTAKDASEETRDFYMKNLGYTKDILTSYGDEQGAGFVVCQRNFHKYFERYGIHVGMAGHSVLFYKGAHLMGVHEMGGDPDSVDRIKRWKDMGDTYIGFYATQHTGSENPAYIRRQNGMLGYMNGLNLIFNYEFALGPWNDLANELYKPMVVAYENHGGLVDTLQWEGYREAVDDIRYATLLQQEIRKALQSDDVEYKTEARKALRYLAVLNPATMDLDTVRSEMIVYILKLRSMAAPKKG